MTERIVAGFEFLSTLSLRRATGQIFGIALNDFISIHALLTESDVISSVPSFLSSYFYPRSPYGERPRSQIVPIALADFYPRSPYGERPYLLGKFWDLVGISIHALLTESDGQCLYLIATRL